MRSHLMKTKIIGGGGRTFDNSYSSFLFVSNSDVLNLRSIGDNFLKFAYKKKNVHPVMAKLSNLRSQCLLVYQGGVILPIAR